MRWKGRINVIKIGVISFIFFFFECIFVMLIWKSRDKLTTNPLFGFVIIIIYYNLLLYSTEKKWKSRFLTYHISGTPWPRNLKIFLWCLAYLKMYQKKFEVSTISGTWLTRGLKMAKMAILLHLYITIAGKSDFLKFLILLLCCLYCVVVLFSMFLLGPRCPYPVLTLSRTN